MVLPKKDPKPQRPKAITIRVSKDTYTQLKSLAESHNLSQADVIEYLIKTEYKQFLAKAKTK